MNANGAGHEEIEAPSTAAPYPDDQEFDETAYLEANPDVRQGVVSGRLKSGRQHYELFGRAEGRLSSGRPPARREKLIGGLNLRDMVGVEIGALAAPIVRRDEGQIFYIDHTDTETLRQLNKDVPHVDPSRIVDVDMVWGATTLQDCIGADRKVDYVVNSHVVEHVPDLVTWLQEIHSILKLDGHLRMAIPDRRFTFDFLRRESALEDVLDAYIRRARCPLPRAILDHFLHYVEINHAEAWNGTLDPKTIKPLHASCDALEKAQHAHRSGEYFDAHCWVFTPLSFAVLCIDLSEMELLPMACSSFHDTQPMEIEFFVRMQPQADVAKCVASWRNVVDRLVKVEAPSIPAPKTVRRWWLGPIGR